MATASLLNMLRSTYYVLSNRIRIVSHFQRLFIITLVILLNGGCAMVNSKTWWTEIHCRKTRWYSILQSSFNDSKTLLGFNLLEYHSSDMEKSRRHASKRSTIVLRVTLWEERQEKIKLIVAGRWKAWDLYLERKNKKGQELIYNQTVCLGWNVTLIHSSESISIAWLMWTPIVDEESNYLSELHWWVYSSS